MLAEQYRLVRLQQHPPIGVPIFRIACPKALLGGIRYDMDSTALAEANDACPPQGYCVQGRVELRKHRFYPEGSYPYLPGTAGGSCLAKASWKAMVIPAEFVWNTPPPKQPSNR